MNYYWAMYNKNILLIMFLFVPLKALKEFKQ